MGWTQETLAQKSGVSERLIAGIERGELENNKTSITLSKVEDLAKALGVSALWLLGADEMQEKHLVSRDEPDIMDAAVDLLQRASDLIDQAKNKLKPRPGSASHRTKPGSASSIEPSAEEALASEEGERIEGEDRKR